MSTNVTLTPEEVALRDGVAGPGPAFAMDLLIGFARAVGARALLPAASAHVDSCIHTGRASVDFAETLLQRGARVAIPTTLNVGSADLIYPDNMQSPPDERAAAARLMALYRDMGCAPTFTCAPYAVGHRPERGSHVAWAESNAVVFANSVLGARTERYGDFIDICCAVTGRVPAFGLHLDANRRARVLIEITGGPPEWVDALRVCVAAGHIAGRVSGPRVPAILGLDAACGTAPGEDDLKALGATAASSGAVGLFHIIGRTPEAPDMAAAFQGHAPEDVIQVTPDDLRRTIAGLSTVADATPLKAVVLGTPHASVAECAALLDALSRPGGAPRRPAVPVFLNMARATHATLKTDGRLADLTAAGVQPVVDTCVYVTRILHADVLSASGAVMTNSGKMAYYGPGNLGLDVAFGSLEECVASAAAGRVVRL